MRKLLFEKLIKYAVVGGLGTVVNEGVLLSLKPLVPITVALFVAIEASILFNFFLNDIWTFRHERDSPLPVRLVKFHIASLTGGIVQYITVITLVVFLVHSELSLMSLLFASPLHISSLCLATIDFLGILSGFLIRFLLSIKYVWR